MINQSKVKVQWCPYWKSIKPAFFWKCACERKQNRPTAGNLRFSTAKACFKLEYLHQYHNYITQAVKSSAYNLKKVVIRKLSDILHLHLKRIKSPAPG